MKIELAYYLIIALLALGTVASGVTYGYELSDVDKVPSDEPVTPDESIDDEINPETNDNNETTNATSKDNETVDILTNIDNSTDNSPVSNIGANPTLIPEEGNGTEVIEGELVTENDTKENKNNTQPIPLYVTGNQFALFLIALLCCFVIVLANCRD